jgi:hypothetical protein
MSLRTISLSALPLARANAANAARTLSTTAVYRKSVVDQVKDAAQTVSVTRTRQGEGKWRGDRGGQKSQTRERKRKVKEERLGRSETLDSH